MFEHVIAFAIFGALFSLAYPKRIIFACYVFFSVVTLEYLQTLTPDRHGDWHNNPAHHKCTNAEASFG